MNNFIPAFLLNWNGSEFLTFYAAAFLVAVLWTTARLRKAHAPFQSAPGTKPHLDDPVEIAYLAGGATRCAEVALVHLIEINAVSWRKGGTFKTGTLIPNGPLPAEVHWFERVIYSAILAAGDRGLLLKDLMPVIKQNVPALEGRLAKLGLRPTAAEISRAGSRAIFPFHLLLTLGILKLLVGLVRDKPVGYLIFFLIVTVLAMLWMKHSVKKITPDGQKVLDQLRSGRLANPQPGITGVALFGIAGATTYAEMPVIDPGMMKEMKKLSPGHVDSSGGCGTSGCSSGCGGSGGCGGCGGCGG